MTYASQSVENAIERIQVHAKALTGMLEAPSLPSERVEQFPFSLCYEMSGSIETFTATFGDELTTIVCELHCSRTLLPRAVYQAMALRVPFIKKLMGDPMLDGAVSTIRGVRWKFGQLQYGGTTTIGYRFEIDTKQMQTV